MDDQQACCILEICCGGDPALSRQALADYLLSELGKQHGPPVTPEMALAIATIIKSYFDLAPKGLITPLIQFTAEMARRLPYTG